MHGLADSKALNYIISYSTYIAICAWDEDEMNDAPLEPLFGVVAEEENVRYKIYVAGKIEPAPELCVL